MLLLSATKTLKNFLLWATRTDVMSQIMNFLRLHNIFCCSSHPSFPLLASPEASLDIISSTRLLDGLESTTGIDVLPADPARRW